MIQNRTLQSTAAGIRRVKCSIKALGDKTRLCVLRSFEKFLLLFLLHRVCTYILSLTLIDGCQKTKTQWVHLNTWFQIWNTAYSILELPLSRPAANRLACSLGVVIKAILILNSWYVGMSRRTFFPTSNLPVFIILFPQTGLVISNQDFGLIRISCFNSLFWVTPVNKKSSRGNLPIGPMAFKGWKLVIFIFSIHVRPKPLLLLLFHSFGVRL